MATGRLKSTPKRSMHCSVHGSLIKLSLPLTLAELGLIFQLTWFGHPVSVTTTRSIIVPLPLYTHARTSEHHADNQPIIGEGEVFLGRQNYRQMQ